MSPYIPITQYKSEVPQEAPVDQEEADLQRALALRFDSAYDIKAFISSFAAWKLRSWRGFKEKEAVQVRIFCGNSQMYSVFCAI